MKKINQNNHLKLLLISNSASPGESYLQKSGEDINDHIRGYNENVILIPYAAVTCSFDDYVNKVNTALEKYDIKVKGIHRQKRKLEAITSASAIFVAGGNTFQLLKMMQEQGLTHAIKERVNMGIPYVGWSAGSNVTCPTICTTNDMPIVEPLSFQALNLVPFQINPHYLDAHPSNHGGETREQRILEYIEANPKNYVVGLREGCRIFIEGEQIRMAGDKSVRIFKKGKEPMEYDIHSDFSFLLH